MNFTVREVIWIIFSFALSIIAVRFSFTFDLNRFLENRRKNFIEKAKNICPHCAVIKKDGNYGFKSTFISPSWTTQRICQQCWTILYHLDHDEENERIAYLLKNPEVFDKQNEKFKKLLKKAGLL